MAKLGVEVVPVTNRFMAAQLHKMVKECHVVSLERQVARTSPVSMINYLKAVLRVLRAVPNSKDVDLTLACDANLLDMLSMQIASMLLGKPSVVLIQYIQRDDFVSYRDLKTTGKSWVQSILVLLGKEIRKFLAGRANLLLAIGPDTLKRYSRAWNIPESGFQLTRNGPAFQPMSTKSVTERSIDAIFVGRFTRSKGVHLLPTICRHVADEVPEFRMVAVGGTESEVMMLKSEASELGIENHIDIRGYLEPQAISSLLCESKIFVLPSSRETSSMSTIEAMAAGCVCVVSNIPALAEICRGSGLLARVGDADSFAKAMESVLEDKSFAATLSKRSKEDSNRFSWQNILEEELHAYQTTAFRLQAKGRF